MYTIGRVNGIVWQADRHRDEEGSNLKEEIGYGIEKCVYAAEPYGETLQQSWESSGRDAALKIL